MTLKKINLKKQSSRIHFNNIFNHHSNWLNFMNVRTLENNRKKTDRQQQTTTYHIIMIKFIWNTPQNEYFINK